MTSCTVMSSLTYRLGVLSLLTSVSRYILERLYSNPTPIYQNRSLYDDVTTAITLAGRAPARSGSSQEPGDRAGRADDHRQRRRPRAPESTTRPPGRAPPSPHRRALDDAVGRRPEYRRADGEEKEHRHRLDDGGEKSGSRCPRAHRAVSGRKRLIGQQDVGETGPSQRAAVEGQTGTGDGGQRRPVPGPRPHGHLDGDQQGHLPQSRSGNPPSRSCAPLVPALMWLHRAVESRPRSSWITHP